MKYLEKYEREVSFAAPIVSSLFCLGIKNLVFRLKMKSFVAARQQYYKHSCDQRKWVSPSCYWPLLKTLPKIRLS